MPPNALPSPMTALPDFSAAADRNKQPILDVLRTLLPASGQALEIASGTGQHAAWFAAALPGWTWQPSDLRADGFASICAWAAQQGAANVRAPMCIDVTQPEWAVGDAHFGLVYCANLLHIAPWDTCGALMRGVARHLAGGPGAGGLLVTYGPYFESGTPPSEGNLAFDASLRAQDPRWGIRQLADVETVAGHAGLRLVARHAMPANNLLLAWARERRASALASATAQASKALG
jgi:Protein of unknown function (DUF938)